MRPSSWGQRRRSYAIQELGFYLLESADEPAGVAWFTRVTISPWYRGSALLFCWRPPACLGSAERLNRPAHTTSLYLASDSQSLGSPAALR